MTLKKIFLLIFTLVFFESFAILIVNVFRPAAPLNGGGFIDDYINFPTLDCVFEPELTRDFSIQKTAQSLNKNAASFGTPIVGDITGDGNPEVLILQNPGNTWPANLTTGSELIYKTKNIVVYNYDGSNLAQTSVLTTPFFINLEGPNPFLIARVPGFTNPLVIVAASSSEPTAAYKSRLVAYEFSGGVFIERWVSSDTYGQNVPFGTNFAGAGVIGPYQYSSGGAPGIADFDQNGTPEVYIFNEIFDATSGAKLADGGNFGQGVSQVKTIGYDMHGGSISLTVAADITNSPGLELAAGNTVYNVTNTAGTWSMTPINAGFNVNGSAARDGFTSIADINNDGRLDVVVTTARQRTVANSRTVYAWTVDLANNPVLIASNTIPDSPLSSPLDNQYEAGTGVAFIGDIDGDLAPEIGVTSHKYLTMFEYNGSPILQIRPGYPQVTNDRSGYTLITMFDFNQDGNQELVYRDERELRIINGVTGGDLATFPVYSATAGEGAIVADLDGDGQAEIVVTDSETFPIGDFPLNPGAYLTVYETASDPWAPARPIWNQYGYFNVNILGDLSVPQNQLNHAIRAIDLFPNLDPVDGCFPPNAQPLNSFLVQGTFYNDSGCRTANIPAFDVEIDNASLFARRTCDPTVLEISFNIRNNFTAQDIPTDMKISFYKEEADGTLTFLNAIIDAGQIITQADGWVQFDEVITSDLIPAAGTFELVIIANNTGTVDSPDRLLECNYTNNTSIAIPVVDLPTYTISSSSDVLCAPGNQLILTPVSSNSLAVNPEKKWQRVNLAGFPDFEISDGSTDPNLPGVTYQINADEELIVNNLPPGDFSFVFDFVGCDLIETVTDFSVEVSLTPSPAFDKNDVGCFGESSGQIFLLSTDLEPGINYTLLDENQNPVSGYSPVSSALVGDVLFDDLPIGIYSIAYFNEANTTCSGLSPPIEIFQPDPFIVQSISNVPTTCGIPDNGSIELTLSGGTAPYTFTSISRGGTPLAVVPGALGTTYTFTGLEAGNYELVFTDAEGCPVIELETVGTIPAPDILLSANPAYCENDQITITASIVEAGTLDPSVVYNWVSGGTTLSGASGNFGGGTYTITAGSGINPPTLTLENISPADYTFTLEARGGGSCDLDFPIDITVNPNPEADFIPSNVSCFGGNDGTLEVIGTPVGVGPFSYQLIRISNNSLVETRTDGLFSGLVADDYLVRISNTTTGCTFETGTYTITEPSEFLVSNVIAVETTCGILDNGSIELTLSGGTAPYTFTSISRGGNLLTGFVPGISGTTYTFTGLEAGDYELVFTDANGCPVVELETVGTIPAPEILLSANPAYCENDQIIITPSIVQAGTLDASVVYSWVSGGTTLSGASGNFGGGTYTITAGSGINPPTLTLENIAPADYTFTLEARGGGSCDLDFPIDITVNPNPEADFISANVSCFGGNDGTLEVIGTPVGVGPFSYQLIRISNNSPVETRTDGLFSGLVADDYLVRISNTTTGCTFETGTYTITEPSEFLVSNVIAVETTCGILDNGSIELTLSGGTAPYTFTSISRGGNLLTGFVPGISGTTYTFTGLEAGNYELIFTDAEGCPVIELETVGTIPAPDILLSANSAYCENDQITITSSIVQAGTLDASVVYSWVSGGTTLSGLSGNFGGGTYIIAPGSGINPPTLTLENIAPADYTFTLEARGGGSCDLDFPIDITVNPNPEADFISANVSCFGGNDGTLEVIGTPVGVGPFSYQLIRISNNSPVETRTDGLFSGLVADDYLVRISNTTTGCTFETGTYTITEPSEFLVSNVIAVETTCGILDNGSIELTLSGGTAPYTFTSISRGGNLLTGFVPGISGSTYTFTGLEAGDYELVFTDANGCPVVELETVGTIPLPDILLSANPAYCEDELILISSSIAEIGTLVAPVSYTWVSGGVALSGSSGNFAGGTYTVTPGIGIEPPTLTLENIAPADYIFTLEVRGGGSCDLDFPIDITVNPLPVTDFEVLDVLCFGGTGSINLISGSEVGHTYTLSNGETNNTGIFSDLPAGDYSVTITSAFGCSQVLDYTINQPDELLINAIDSADPTCGAINGKIVFEVIGGIKDYEITINGTELNTSNFDVAISGDTYTIRSLAPDFYSIAVIDANSCPVDAPNLFELVNNDGFEIDILPMEDQICDGGTAVLTPQLTVPGGVNPVLNWYFDNSLTQEITSSTSPAPDGNIYQISGTGSLSISGLPVGTSTYYLVISGVDICEFVTEATVTVIPPIQTNVSATPVICFGESNGTIQVDSPTGGSGTYEYSLDGNTWQVNTLFENLAAGSYSVFVRDDSGLNGCELVIPDVVVDGPAGPITESQAVTLPVSCGLENGAVRDVLVTGGWGNYTFEWRKDDPQNGQVLTQGTLTGIEDLASGDYFLIITDEKGCIEIFEYKVGIASDPVYELVDPIDNCLGELIEIKPVHIAPDPSLPPSAGTEIRWYKEANQVDLISNGPDSTDPSIVYTIDDSDWLNPVLQIENLPIGIYDFYFYVVCTGQEIKIEVEVFDKPNVVFETDPVSCFGGVDGKIRSVSGTAPEYTYSVDGASPISITDLEALNLAAGTYEIQVLTPAGCPQVVSLVVEEPSGLLEIQLVSELDPSCSLENGEIRLSLLGGNPDYTLTMNGIAVTGFDPSVDGTEVIIQNLAGGTYTFELNDSKNCTSATLSVTLDPLEVPDFSATGDEICAFDPVSGLANTGILRPVVVNLAGSSPVYTWYYENQSGTEIQISDGDQLFGGTAVINGSGELELTGVIASDTPYKFFLEVTGDLVCPSPKIEVELKVNFTPEVTFEKTDIICFGETTGEIRVQSGGLAGYVYTLNTGETNTNGEFQNLAAGNYTIEISNGTSCIQTVDVEIVQPKELLITALDFTDPTCDAINGEIRFEISGGTQAYDIFVNGDVLNSSNFSFTESGGVYTLQNLAPGQFSIRVLDANGCEVESTDLFSLTNNAGIDIISNPVSDEVCEGETAQLTPDLTLPGGVTPVLRWYKDAATTQIINSSPTPDANGIIYQIDAQGVLSISNLQAGDYKYYLRISGPGICTQVTEATITVVALPAVTIDISNISCFGANDGSIQISSGNDPSYSYTLSNGESNSTGNFVNLTPGIYSLEVATPSGCPQLLNFEILEPADLIINDLDFVNPSCDENNGQITFEVIGGTGDYSISINGQLLNDSNFNFIENGQEYTVKGLSPGDYSIQVTDENGCSEIETDLFTLVNESGIFIGSNPLLEEIMLGEVATLTPDLTIPSGSVFTLSWYFNSTATQIITSDSNPAPDGVIYEIDANDVLTITGLNPGTYTYYYEISGPGICVTITEAIVVVKSPLTADIVSTPVTCFGGSDGSISVENIVGGNPPLSFSLDGITWQSSPVFENLPVGTYTVYITDPSITVGFLTTFPNVVIETTATQIEINTPDLISASCDLPNGAIRNLQVIGGTGSYSFEWRKDDALSGELLSNGTLTGLEDIFPGEYFITITDSNGCSETFSFVIDELPDPVYELVPPIDICIGEEATIRPVFIAPNPPVPTSPTDIMWYKDAGQVGLISNGPDPDDASIIYTIDDTDWINPQLTIANLPIGVHDFYFYVVCTGQEIKVEVTVFENPDMEFETSPVSCFGGIDGKILSISGDMPEYTYSLDGAAALTLSELEALELAAGNYSLEVLTPAGCNQIIPITIEGPDSELLLSGITQLDPGCGADNGKIQGQITGGWAPYTVNVFKDGLLLNSFSQSVNSFSLNDLGIGQYTIEVIDDKGCTIVSDIIELIDGPTQLLIDNEEICEGSPVTLIPRLDPPVSDFTIQWFFDQGGNQPIVSSPNPASDGVIYEISATGELTITGLPYSSSPYAFYATATGPDVCPGFVGNSLVQVNEVPNATISITAEQCFGEGGIITVNASGGSGGLQYSLDGVNFQSSNVFNVPQGIYSVTVRSGQGCDLIISDQEVTGPASPIEVEDLIQIDATCGESDGSISFSLIGGFGGYEVDLIRNSTVISTQTTQADGSISFTGLGAGTYSIQVRDAGSCSITFDNLVQIENIPTPILVDDVSICEGEIATLIPTTTVNNGDTQFTWYFDSQANNPIPVGAAGDLTFSISPEGHLAVAGLPAKSTPYEYFVLASGTDICSTIPEKAQVKVIEIPNLRVSNPSIVCDPTGTVDLTAYIEGFNPAVYDYNVVSPNGSPMRLDELDSVDLSGDYRVSSAVKGTSCWNQPQRILVVISQTLLEAEFNYLVDFGGGNIFQNEDIPLGEDVYFNDLSRGNAVIWNWDFGDGFTSNEENPVHTYNEVGSFNVKLRVVDDIGCESIYEMVVNVIDDFEVIIPNAFTPKGNKNQYFKPEYRGIASMEFYIFNTWGELIYKATSLEDIGWDGTLNGKDTPNGNYVYRGIFTSRNGVKIEKAGVFILIR